MVKPPRERNSLPRKGWSVWIRAMVPPYYTIISKNLQPWGRNQVGFISSSIRKALPLLSRHCGIYEWGVKRPLLGVTKIRVVYVGSTGALRGRIQRYCRDGSHKEDLINAALLKGYELWVRVKPTRCNSKLIAEIMEIKLLAKYNYAWNKRDNGNSIRHILRWVELTKAV